MELTKFLNLCAMLFGVIAVIFLSKALFSSAEQILRVTYHYSSMGWPSVAIISDKAVQKADTLASIIFVFIVLILQLCSLFIKEDISFTSTWQKGVVIAIIFVSIVSFIVHNIDVGTGKYFEHEIKVLAARNYIKSDFERSSCPLYSDVEAIAKEYFNFCKKADENNPDFVKRFACFLGYSVQKDADFSKFR
jgi:glucan phosphoethanolaminetransferase (alkaline phosphatase superfamily)